MEVFPIRYEDQPREVWTVDPSLFPYLPEYTKSFTIHRVAEPTSDAESTPPRTAGLHADLWLPEAPSELLWQMADHGAVREAFSMLMTSDTSWRILLVRGPSETGKTRITKQILANALCIPDLCCGRFDFKGVIDMDAEVRRFVQHLNVPLPPQSASLTERFSGILNTLLDLKRPTLLVFDTYEMAARSQQDWIEKEVLVCVVRAPWLRVIVVGQRTPERSSAVWCSASRATIELAPPHPAEWYEFGRQNRPGLTLEFVEQACLHARNKASTLAELLGPVI